MWKKTLVAVAAAGGIAAAPMAAQAGDDRAAGALAGGLIGALIGSSVSGGDGAAVGGIFGAIAGAAIADDRHDYRGYHHDHRRYSNRGHSSHDYNYRNDHRAPTRDYYRGTYPQGYTRAYNRGYTAYNGYTPQYGYAYRGEGRRY